MNRHVKAQFFLDRLPTDAIQAKEPILLEETATRPSAVRFNAKTGASSR